MKKLLFGLALLISTNAFSQDYKVVRNISDLRKGVAAVDGSVVYVLGYRTQGDGGGGVYIYSDTSKATDDGGAIIKSNGLAGAWIHEVQNKIVNLKWWGIRPLSATGTTYNLEQDDIAQEFKAALKFINERANGAELYIEAGQGGVWGNGTYYCSETWLLDKPGIVITGTKSPVGKPSTKIIWDAHKLCIKVTEPAKSVTLEQFEVTQINAAGFGDTTGHGIYSNSAIYADNLSFLNLAGNAIHIEACAIPNDPVYGNADHSVLKDIWINYTNHGLYMKGCDVNKVTVEKLQVSNVRRWGVFDDSFLGNDYREPHFAYCGFAGNGNFTTVIWKDKKYTTRYQIDDKFVNKGYEPDKHPEIWFEHWSSGYATPWEADKRYWSAGTFALINDNAVHAMYGNYTEDGQAPGFLNTRSRLLDGTRGTQTLGGAQSRVMFGTEYHNANQVAPGVLVGYGGYEFPQAPLHAVQDFAKSGMLDIAKFESVGNAAWIKIQNSVGQGYINLQDNAIKLHSVDGNFLGLDMSGLYVKSLGVSTDNKVLTWNESTGRIGYRPYNAGGGSTSGGVSQEALDAAIAAIPTGVSQSAFNALVTRVNSLDAVISIKAGKDEVKVISDALAALTVRVNALPTTSTPNPQLTQIISELQAIINRLNTISN